MELGTEALCTRLTEFLNSLKKFQMQNFCYQIIENSIYIWPYQKQKHLEIWTRQYLPVSKSLRKKCTETRKIHREILPVLSSSATPLWKTLRGSWFYYLFFWSNTFYQLSRKSNPVFKTTLLEVTCRRDINTKVRHGFLFFFF